MLDLCIKLKRPLPSQDGISYQWSDGTEGSFTYWEVSNYYPEGPMGEGGCVTMDVTGRWKEEECDREISGAVCYTPPPSEFISHCISYFLIHFKPGIR